MGIARQEHRFTGLGHAQKRSLQQPRGSIDTKPTTIHTQRSGQTDLTGGHRSFPFQGTADLRKLRKIPAARRLSQQPFQRRGQGRASTMNRQMQRPSTNRAKQ